MIKQLTIVICILSIALGVTVSNAAPTGTSKVQGDPLSLALQSLHSYAEKSNWKRSQDMLELLKNKMTQSDIVQTLVEDWQINTWAQSGLISYSVDGNTKITLEQSWNGSSWKDEERTIETFDGSGRPVSILGQSYNEGSMTWKDVMETSMTYDFHGDMVEMMMQGWNEDGSILIGTKNTITCNSEHLATEMIQEIYNPYSDEWTFSSRETYTYDASDKMSESFLQLYTGVPGMEWMDQQKATYSYDSHGYYDVILTHAWNGISWENMSRESYEHTGSGDVISQLLELWNTSAWENDSKFTYQYDDKGGTTESIYYTWNGSDWEIIVGTQSSFTYNSDNKPIQETVKTWFINKWENSERLTHTYGQLVAIDDDNENKIQTPADFRLVNYPNPFNASTHIYFKLENPGNISLEIFDLNGRSVKQLINETGYSRGTYNVIWNGTDHLNRVVTSGVYFYRLQMNNNVLVNQCVLLK